MDDLGTFLLLSMGGIFLALGWAMLISSVFLGANLPCAAAFVAAIAAFVVALAKMTIPPIDP